MTEHGNQRWKSHTDHTAIRKGIHIRKKNKSEIYFVSVMHVTDWTAYMMI